MCVRRLLCTTGTKCGIRFMSSVKDEDILTSKILRNKEIRRIEVGYAKKLLAISAVGIAVGYYYFEYIHEDPIEYIDDDK
jgi:hypothetical protein